MIDGLRLLLNGLFKLNARGYIQKKAKDKVVLLNRIANDLHD